MKEKLTQKQKEYIRNNYHNSQTWKIAEDLRIEDKDIIYNFAEKNNLKKDNDFVVIRKQNSLSLEQCDFILKNYKNTSNKEILKKLNITYSQLHSFANRRGLIKESSKDSVLYTQEQKDFMVKNYPYMQNSELKKHISLSKSQISYLAYKLNLTKSKSLKRFSASKLTFKQKKFIKDNYTTMKTNDICRKLNLSYEQVKSYASNLKLKKDAYYSNRYNGYWKECLNKHNEGYNVYDFLGDKKEPILSIGNLYKSKYGKYYVNQDYFEKIDNEWKAYWLGFMYADGTNYIKRNSKKNNKMEYSISLCLAQIDKSHIEKFKESIQSDSPIKDNDVKLNEKFYKSSKISICNKKICEDLNSLGCMPKKSLILKFPTEEQVPKEFIRDFIRGYFDGDGCIHINLEKENIRFNVLGTLDFITKLQEVLVGELELPITKIQKKKDNEAYSMEYGGIITIEKIYKYLYNDCNIYLDRKLEKFNTLLCLG